MKCALSLTVLNNSSLSTSNRNLQSLLSPKSLLQYIRDMRLEFPVKKIHAISEATMADMLPIGTE